jgi:hypothetical protein
MATMPVAMCQLALLIHCSNGRIQAAEWEAFQSVSRAPLIFDGNRVDAIDPAHDV